MRVFRFGWLSIGTLSFLLFSPCLRAEEGSASATGATSQLSSGSSEKHVDLRASEGGVGVTPSIPEKNQSEALPPPPPGFTEVKIDQTGSAKPPLNLLDLHGYLRLRGDLNKGVDLDLPAYQETDPYPRYPQFPHPMTGKGNTLSTANMRFRLEPTLNISEDVRIMGQIDMLDNLVLGSTVSESSSQNAAFLSQSQMAHDKSITVKRLWGEVKTPLGLLRFGRMGSQWGLGIMANDGGPAFVDRGPLTTSTDWLDPIGQCFDCDYGSTVDRIMFITKIFGHYIVPVVDFTSEGPTYANFNDYGGQSIDADQLDDVHSYILSIFKRDKPEDIRLALDQGDWVLNYGLYFTYRNQSYDSVTYQTDQSTNYFIRSSTMLIPDIWLRFMWRKLRIELEAIVVTGSMRVSMDKIDYKRVNMFQWGGVLQADYRLLNNQLLLGFESGVASGDDNLAFGTGPFMNRRLDTTGDLKRVDNFIFNRDYHVDLILWRQIVGAVTNAYYLKASAQYTFPLGIGAKASGIYSGSIDKNTRGKDIPLGLEFDFDVFYFSNDHFHAGVSYGLLIPLAGMNYKKLTDSAGDKDKDASVAHRVMGRLVLYF